MESFDDRELQGLQEQLFELQQRLLCNVPQAERRAIKAQVESVSQLIVVGRGRLQGIAESDVQVREEAVERALSVTPEAAAVLDHASDHHTPAAPHADGHDTVSTVKLTHTQDLVTHMEPGEVTVTEQHVLDKERCGAQQQEMSQQGTTSRHRLRLDEIGCAEGPMKALKMKALENQQAKARRCEVFDSVDVPIAHRSHLVFEQAPQDPNLMQLGDLLAGSIGNHVYALSKNTNGSYLPDSDLRGIPVFRQNPYRPKEDKSRPEIGSDKVDFVALYFCGSQSSSCEAFTARLMEIYHAVRWQGGSFEVVQVCGDESRKACMSSLASVPWLAVPFDHQAVATMLFRRFRVSSMPTMVMLNEHGKVINSETISTIVAATSVAAARDAFPWGAPTLTEVLNGKYSCCNDYGFTERSWEDLQKVEAIGFLCVASWNPASAALQKALKQCYTKVNRAEFGQGKRFEVVLVSADHDEAGFKVSREGAPWLTVPFSDKIRTKWLRNHLE